jgi:hypothetical protein
MGNRLVPLLFSALFCLALFAPAQALGLDRGTGGTPGELELAGIRTSLSHFLFEDTESLEEEGEGVEGEEESGDEEYEEYMTEDSPADVLPKRTAMIEAVKKDVIQGLTEFWGAIYLWTSPYLLAKGKSTQQDMRAAIAQGVLFADYGIHLRTVNFKDELGIDDVPDTFTGLIQLELGARFENHVFRLLWWYWEDCQDRGDFVYVKVDTAFGDKVYLAGRPIRFPFKLMDTKLIYEYRIIPWYKFQLFFGISLHWLYTIDYNVLWDTYEDQGHIHDSAFVDQLTGGAYFQAQPIAEDRSDGHYPFVSLSLRVDARPIAGVHLFFDMQEMWVFYGNYTDLRIGIWNEIAYGFRIGAGYRIWAVTADVEEVGSHKTNFQGRAVFQGIWVGLFWNIFP